MASESKPPKSRTGKVASAKSGGLIRKLRKPLAPPTRVGDDERKYQRARERERTRRGDQT